MLTFSNSSVAASTDSPNPGRLFSFRFACRCVVSTRPRPILRLRDELCRDGISFDIRNESREALISPQPVIEGFVLPKSVSCAIQDSVCGSRRRSLQCVHKLPYLDFRREQSMDVIRHHDVGKELVVIQFGIPFPKSEDNTGSDQWVFQPEWPFDRSVQNSVNGTESFPCRSFRRFLSQPCWEGAVQPPGQKDCFPLRKPVRKISAVVGHSNSIN
jgi:hypothetical protein